MKESFYKPRTGYLFTIKHQNIYIDIYEKYTNCSIFSVFGQKFYNSTHKMIFFVNKMSILAEYNVKIAFRVSVHYSQYYILY